MRDSAVAIAKIAVLSAMRRRGRWGGGGSPGVRAPGGSGGSDPFPPVVWVSI
jgi:hypothetical protein